MPCRVISCREDFPSTAASLIGHAIAEAQRAHGHCTLGLSGGSTPAPVYRALHDDPSLDWHTLTVFLIDERFVSDTHDDSNSRMVRDTLLADHPLRENAIVFPDTSLPLENCVSDYDARIAALRPDIVLLGMGDDGHIASLFPPLDEPAFGSAHVIHTTTDRFSVRDRLSVTLPVLQAAPQRIFLISGEGKRQLLSQMLDGTEKDPHLFPALALMDERTVWVVQE